MLTFFDDYHNAKILRYWLIPSRDTDDHIILQSAWLRGTISHTQPKVIQMLPFFDDYLHAKILRDWLIPSRDTEDQRKLKSDWLRTI